MKAVLQYPRVDGSMLLGDILEFNAINNPDVAFFVFPDGSGSRRIISHLDFYRASHRVAHLIHQRFREGEKVAVFARVETILQHALTVGMILAGVIPVLMSFKIPADSVTNLLRAISCRNLMVSRESLGDLVATVEADFTAEESLQIMGAPSVLQVYPELARQYDGEAPFRKFDIPVRRPALEDVMLYLHTSGSTGYPKPIRHTHQMFLNWCNQAPVADLKTLGKTIDLGTMALPAFHISGLYNQLYVPMGALTATCVYAPISAEDPKALPTVPDAHNVLSCLKVTKANALVIYPAILELWTSSEESAEALKVMQSLEYISYIGSALSPKSGRILLDAGVKFTGVYATSEIGALTASYLDDADWEHWQYVRFIDPSGVRWEKKSDRLYECQVLATDKLAVAVENLSDVRGYATSDLFEKHPTIEGLWK
ncbi:hypothetical protein JVU11DRAFT_10265 [Chiua virens]|nr:hypothetical protein JVU11DRAFT_10265 [Chiua virens]